MIKAARSFKGDAATGPYPDVLCIAGTPLQVVSVRSEQSDGKAITRVRVKGMVYDVRDPGQGADLAADPKTFDCAPEDLVES